jgi:putative PIN family toxin of toxin-antitoxin system
MLNVVIDANVVVSAALKPNSIPEKVIRLARTRGTICLSERILEEFRLVLSRPKFSAAVSTLRRDEILLLLSAAGRIVTPAEVVRDCRDAKDNIYLEAALEVPGALIVSGDQDLLELDPWRGTRIMHPAEFVEFVGCSSR